MNRKKQKKNPIKYNDYAKLTIVHISLDHFSYFLPNNKKVKKISLK